MDHQQTGVASFREVDRDGNPVTPGAENWEPAGTARTLRLTNPFIVVLWLLAAAMVATGLWSLLRGPVAVGPVRDGLSLEFVLFTFAPQLLLAGFAAVIFLLFWHAWQWQRRRG